MLDRGSVLVFYAVGLFAGGGSTFWENNFFKIAYIMGFFRVFSGSGADDHQLILLYGLIIYIQMMQLYKYHLSVFPDTTVGLFGGTKILKHAMAWPSRALASPTGQSRVTIASSLIPEGEAHLGCHAHSQNDTLFSEETRSYKRIQRISDHEDLINRSDMSSTIGKKINRHYHTISSEHMASEESTNHAK